MLITGGMVVFAGLATVAYGLVKGDWILVVLGVVLTFVGGFMWGRHK